MKEQKAVVCCPDLVLTDSEWHTAVSCEVKGKIVPVLN